MGPVDTTAEITEKLAIACDAEDTITDVPNQDVANRVLALLQSTWQLQEGTPRSYMEMMTDDYRVIKSQYRVFGFARLFDIREDDENSVWDTVVTETYNSVKQYADTESARPETHYMVMRRPPEARVGSWSDPCKRRVVATVRFTFFRKEDWDNPTTDPGCIPGIVNA